MKDDLHQVFDFVIAEDGDLMLLIYRVDGEPVSPSFEVDEKEKTLWLHRSQNNDIELQEIDEDIINKLLNMKKILVCEIGAPSETQNPEPEYIYEAVSLQ